MQRLPHLALVEGLGKEIVHAGFQAFLADFCQSVGGERNNGRALGSLLSFTNATGGGEAVHLRHFAIHQDQVETLPHR